MKMFMIILLGCSSLLLGTVQPALATSCVLIDFIAPDEGVLTFIAGHHIISTVNGVTLDDFVADDNYLDLPFAWPNPDPPQGQAGDHVQIIDLSCEFGTMSVDTVGLLGGVAAGLLLVPALAAFGIYLVVFLGLKRVIRIVKSGTR